MSNETQREFAEKCEKFYAAVGETFEIYNEKEEDGLDPKVSLAVVSKLFASIGWNLEIDKKELLAYMADVVDDVYYTNERKDHE